jgi:hypothetical protein
MKTRSIKLFVAALVLSTFGIQAQAAPAGPLSGLTPAQAVALGLATIVGGVVVYNEIDDDDDDNRQGGGDDGGDDGGETPTTPTTPTTPVTGSTATTGT